MIFFLDSPQSFGAERDIITPTFVARTILKKNIARFMKKTFLLLTSLFPAVEATTRLRFPSLQYCKRSPCRRSCRHIRRTCPRACGTASRRTVQARSTRRRALPPAGARERRYLLFGGSSTSFTCPNVLVPRHKLDTLAPHLPRYNCGRFDIVFSSGAR